MTGERNPLSHALAVAACPLLIAVAQAGEQHGCRLIRRVLRHQPPFEGGFQYRLSESEEVTIKCSKLLIGECCFLLQSRALNYFSHLDHARYGYSGFE